MKSKMIPLNFDQAMMKLGQRRTDLAYIPIFSDLY